MSDEYYTDVIDSLPFATKVELFKRQMPRWLAFCMAAWFALWFFLGRVPRPRYAARWKSTFVNQLREEMPARALSRWAPRIERLGDLGFSVLGWSKSETIGAKQEAVVLLLNEQGTSLAQVLWIRMIGGHGIEEQTRASFTSFRSDGTELLTAALPDDQLMLTKVLVPDYVNGCFLADTVPVEKVYQQHSGRPDLDGTLKFSRDEALVQYEQYRVRFFQHARDAGFIRLLSPDEVEFTRGLDLPD